MRQHILICGERGVGKSTLIHKLLRSSKRLVYGFVTEKVHQNEDGVSGVYIHAANSADRRYDADNRVGICDGPRVCGNRDVFDTLGVTLLDAQPGGILVMDELGFLENEAAVFCSSVIRAFDGDIPVLAAVKDMETPFLYEVRAHRNAQTYLITLENRDRLFSELLPVIADWNDGQE